MATLENQNLDIDCGSLSSSSSDVYDSDDSQNDPTFDLFEGTRSRFSNLSINRKPKPQRLAKGKGDSKVISGQDSCQIVEEVVKAGQLEKLKVDQCKVYLRKHGLRLTGNKDTLIRRIREHLEIVDGGGEQKYPAASFVVNCKGDACTGDVVLFEQNVYEMFSVASRSATGPPSGTRLVAGRIIKESYGAEKQQHTFTIEVLWSKGEKPLPPLHQLLIKGRNLYRLKTMRQKWEDEAERQNMLSEKHARGHVARSKREIRVQERAMQNMLKLERILKAEDRKKQTDENNTLKIMKQPPQQPQLEPQKFEPRDSVGPRSCKEETSAAWQKVPVPVQMRVANAMDVPLERQALKAVDYNYTRDPTKMAVSEVQNKCMKPVNNSVHWKTSHHENNTKHIPFRNPGRPGGYSSNSFTNRSAAQRHQVGGFFRGLESGITRGNHHPVQRHSSQGTNQACKYYAAGSCYYGDNCRWFHGVSGNPRQH